MRSHTSIFSLIGRNMQAYVISWVSTFFASIVNVLWSVHVFHYDFVTNIDGALASQIGVVVLNELFLLWSVVLSRKYLFGFGGLINLIWIGLMAGFICLLIYAPMIAFQTYAQFTGVEISGQAPLYDEIDSYGQQVIGFATQALQTQYGPVVGKVIAVISGGFALISLSAFFQKKT